MPIVLNNQSPPNGAMNVSTMAGIDVDVVGMGVTFPLAEIEIFVEGLLVFEGSDPLAPFRPPLSGPGSSVASIPDGYHFHLVRIAPSRQEFINVQVRRTQDGYVSAPVAGWSFRAGTDATNDFYFADGYMDEDGYLNPEPGIRRLHVRQLVGELKPHEDTSDGYTAPVILSTAVTPGWPSDIVHTLSSTTIDGYMYLAASTSQGLVITRNETDRLQVFVATLVRYGTRPYGTFRYAAVSSGADAYGGHINANGTTYVINKPQNRIEVFYGIDVRGSGRPPDFIYDAYSTPPLLAGELFCLHVAEGQSTVFPGGSRLYVGGANGLTRIEAYDQESPDGYSAGMDGYGLSYTYGIAGSGTDFPVLGGTIPRVVAIGSNEAEGIFFVATNDGTEIGGGLSQVSISANRLILFMTREGGFLPSNVIRDIAGT